MSLLHFQLTIFLFISCISSSYALTTKTYHQQVSFLENKNLACLAFLSRKSDSEKCLLNIYKSILTIDVGVSSKLLDKDKIYISNKFNDTVANDLCGKFSLSTDKTICLNRYKITKVKYILSKYYE